MVAPLERVKLLQQVQSMHGTARYTSFMPAMRIIFKEDGVRGYFRGNGANIARTLPNYSLKFAVNDLFKFAILKPGQDPATLTFAQLLGVGYLAGVATTTVSYPLLLIRTRIMLDKTMGNSYKGMWDCGVQTLRGEGIRGLYRGFLISLATSPVYVGLQMSLYDVFKRHLPADPTSSTQPVVRDFFAGTLAGLVAQTTCYPGDTVKKQMQGDGIKGNTVFKGTWDCIRQLHRKGGFRAFYPGLGLNSIKCIPE